MIRFFPFLWLSVTLLSSCSMATRESGSAIPVRLYGNGQLTIASMAWNGSGRGEIWFNLRDGESFRGEYSTIAPEVYATDLSVLLGNVGATRFGSVRSGFTTVSSNVQYGMVSAVGDRGTTFVCKYVNTVSMWTWGFTAVGSCLDSKRRYYSAHAASSDTNIPPDIQKASDTSPENPAGPVMTAVDCSDPIVRTEFPALCPTPPPEQNTKLRQPDPIGRAMNPERESSPAQAKPKTNASLIQYDGPKVKSGITLEAEFVDDGNGAGEGRIIYPGNRRVLTGKWTTLPTGKVEAPRLLEKKALNAMRLAADTPLTTARFTDNETVLECVSGENELGQRKGECADNFGNKYHLVFMP